MRLIQGTAETPNFTFTVLIIMELNRYLYTYYGTVSLLTRALKFKGIKLIAKQH